MKLIFLDIDGVLNSIAYCKRVDLKGLRDIDPEAVKLLNKIVQTTGAKVVISSTWRLSHKLEGCQKVLQEAGFEGDVIGVTPRTFQKPDGKWSERGEEIQVWLDNYKKNKGRWYGHLESFVILDDDSDMAHLMNHLVQTSDFEGLEQEHVDRAITMLRY